MKKQKPCRQIEMRQLFQQVTNHPLEVEVKLAAFYALRPSEVLGLKWDAVDFESNAITIRHTVVKTYVDGKVVEVASDTTKTGMYTFPLVPPLRSLLLKEKAQQEENRKKHGDNYDLQYLDYICVDQHGARLKHNDLQRRFNRFLADNGLPKMSFHVLRKSCHHLLCAVGVDDPLREEWMRRGNMVTAALLYSNRMPAAKRSPIEAWLSTLQMEAPLA